MIWIMAGTGDSKKIIEKFKNEYSIMITTATTLGRKNFSNYKNVISKMMNYDEMSDFIDKKNIKLIIDATHPFANDASNNAINASKSKGIVYIRYERKKTKLNKAVLFNSISELADFLKNEKGNILLTIGVKNLNQFSKIKRKKLFVKILPVLESFIECEKHNIIQNNIIAMKGIISVKLLRSIINEYNIKYMVMKDSGIEGGTDLKIKACKLEKIKAYVVKREQIKYPEVYNNINQLIKRVKECIMSGNRY